MVAPNRDFNKDNDSSPIPDAVKNALKDILGDLIDNMGSNLYKADTDSPALSLKGMGHEEVHKLADDIKSKLSNSDAVRAVGISGLRDDIVIAEVHRHTGDNYMWYNRKTKTMIEFDADREPEFIPKSNHVAYSKPDNSDRPTIIMTDGNIREVDCTDVKFLCHIGMENVLFMYIDGSGNGHLIHK